MGPGEQAEVLEREPSSSKQLGGPLRLLKKRLTALQGNRTHWSRFFLALDFVTQPALARKLAASKPVDNGAPIRISSKDEDLVAWTFASAFSARHLSTPIQALAQGLFAVIKDRGFLFQKHGPGPRSRVDSMSSLMHCSSCDFHDSVRGVANLIRSVIEDCPWLPKGLSRNAEFGRALCAFSDGALSVDNQEHGEFLNTGPDSSFYFSFAEFALVATESWERAGDAENRDRWEVLARTFVAAQAVYLRRYGREGGDTYTGYSHEPRRSVEELPRVDSRTWEQVLEAHSGERLGWEELYDCHARNIHRAFAREYS